MGQPALVVLALFTAGCSFLYNPNKIHSGPGDAKQPDAPSDAMIDAAIDAAIDAPPPMDADPTMLMVTDVFPHTIDEGQGDGNSPPQLLVLEGLNFAPGATVKFLGPDGMPDPHVTVVGTPSASGDTKYLAVQVKLPVDPSFSNDEALTLVVSETGATDTMLPGELTLHGLPELTTGPYELATIDSTLYSQIDISSDVSFTGDMTKVATLHAVSSITITGTIHAGGSGSAAGPGGCAGGDLGTAGGCTNVTGGGTGGAGTAAGGGGGFNGPGTAGGANANSGGAAHGDPALASVGSASGNQSSGGGGSTGVGGGGGGTVELVAGGDINLGTIDASGAAGAKGKNALVVGDGGGGGGGGTGGVILVRTDAGVLTLAMDSTLNVAGGPGGPGGAPDGLGNNGGAGGVGANGRIRCDAPGGIGACTMAAHRGPSYATGIAVFQTQAGIDITLDGTTGDIVDFYDQSSTGIQTGEPLAQTFASDALTNLHVSLFNGYNKLCATLKGGTRGALEADSCIEIAYLP